MMKCFLLRATLALSMLGGAGLVVGVVSAPAVVYAQGDAPAAEGEPAGEYEKPTQFSGNSNEDMKYRNLWIAYAAIWLLVFGFIWRTWGKQQTTNKELDDIRKRLSAMEEHDG